MADLPAIAVIADAHLHDIGSDYGNACTTTIDGKRLTLRSWKDSRRSTRLFNESRDALITTLADIQQRGIRHVVLLGDYTDDGQIESTKRFANLIHDYRRKYDMAFYAIPGNHDFYGPVGKHQSTRFISAPGESVLVTSDPEVAATESKTSVLTQNMYCEGLPEALLPMAEFGFFKQPEYLHWETPFGQSDTTESRMFDARSEDGSVVHTLMDSSYLVEPYEGLWLLMIDANVFEPRNGRTDRARKNTFFNSSDAGWNAVLKVKPFLIDWIKEVCARAESSGKHLLAFSHYPIIDTIDIQGAETRLFGNSEVVRRAPSAQVANVLLDAGLRVHFSGHMHVNNEAHLKSDKQVLSNIAVPSIVAFPACYKIIQTKDDSTRISTVPIDSMPIDPVLIRAYREENRATGDKDESALSAITYGDFLNKGIHARVKHRYLKNDWPDDITCQIDNTTALDLAYFLLMQGNGAPATNFGPMNELITPALQAEFAERAARYELTCEDFERCSLMSVIEDWYRLRFAGPMAGLYVSSHCISLYTCLAGAVTEPEPAVVDTHAAFFSLFLSVFKHSLESLKATTSPTEIEL